MSRYIDRDAGFAVFTRGRSLCVRLDGTLDAAMAEGIADQIRNDRDHVRLRLECSSLRRIDPDRETVWGAEPSRH